MNIHDKAYELAAAIKESDEWKAIQEAQKILQKDKKIEEMYVALRTKQMELQQKQLAGIEVSEAEITGWQKQFEITMMHTDVKKLMEAENRLSVILEDVQKILFEAISRQ